MNKKKKTKSFFFKIITSCSALAEKEMALRYNPFQAFSLVTIPSDTRHPPFSELQPLCPSRGILYTGTFSKTGQISQNTYLDVGTQKSYIVWYHSFTLTDQPDTWTVSFGTQTQQLPPKLGSTVVLVYEQPFLTISDKTTAQILGSVTGSLAYTYDTASPTDVYSHVYPFTSRSGLLKDTENIQIDVDAQGDGVVTIFS